MAFIQVTYYSWVLKRNVPLTVVLPVDNYFEEKETKEYKTLYLLHGLTDNCMDWVLNTRIRKWAEDKKLAVVMPSGDNSFYVNQLTPNNDYGEFIGKELVEMTRKMFPLSHKREDTFIAGNSMGGYGAIRNGLKYADTFSHIVGFSSALHMFEEPVEKIEKELFGAMRVFGDLEEAAKTDVNPKVALDELIARGGKLPKVYMCCGLQDRLLESNRIMRDYFKEKKVDLFYEEMEGGHTWEYWDAQLLKVFEWLGV